MKQRVKASSFYRGDANAKSYIESRRGLNGQLLVDFLREILDPGSSLLELGMGPGTDLLLLSRHFDVVGSDYSNSFLRYFRRKHTGIEVLRLDAVEIRVKRTFDSVFSNKVLHHLSPEGLRKSLQRQTELVGKGGILFHSFWLGREKSTVNDLRFTKYMPETMVDLFSRFGEVVMTKVYGELNASDSFCIASRI